MPPLPSRNRTPTVQLFVIEFSMTVQLSVTLRKIRPVRLSSITLLRIVMPVELLMSMPVRLPMMVQFRTVPLVRPWIATPAELRPGLFQSVVLLPSRVMVKPSSTTPSEANWNVAPPPPIGPLTTDVVPAPRIVTTLPTITSSCVVARGDVDRARRGDGVHAALDRGERVAADRVADRRRRTGMRLALPKLADVPVIDVDDVRRAREGEGGVRARRHEAGRDRIRRQGQGDRARGRVGEARGVARGERRRAREGTRAAGRPEHRSRVIRGAAHRDRGEIAGRVGPAGIGQRRLLDGDEDARARAHAADWSSTGRSKSCPPQAPG